MILDSISASVALGERIGLVGPNGAGKTTLLRIAAGIDEPDGGEVSAQARAAPRPARPGEPPRRGVHGRARPADRRPSAAPATSSGWRPSRWPRSSSEHRVDRSPPTPRSSTSSSCWAATRSTSGSTRPCPASASARDEWDAAAGRAVGRRADAGGAGPPRHRRPGPAAARRADEPPRPRRPGVARGAPPATRRRAPRGVPRPGVPRRDRRPASGSCATGG